MEKNDVASFFYYMWNCWCEQECAAAFEQSECGWKHLWNKWTTACYRNKSVFGASEIFFSELSCHNQDLLVKRATEMYDRRKKIK